MFQVGQSIGDYVILQELGKGGYGRVYKVEHTITGRREAMKILAASDASPAEQCERFLREIRLQASLTHPNIAVVHTAFWVNDELALVCELLEGESLKQRLDRQAPSYPQALEIITQVLEALSYAHARGIIHRDISPSNIFLTGGGTVKLIDFGLAKAATDLRLTREGSPVGAAHYMSPEQIRGAQDIDARTDLYSCGVVLYELLVGRKPFDGDNAFDIMKAHTEEAPPVAGLENHQVSELLLRALAKKPEARFQSADAFLQTMRGLQVKAAEPNRRHPLKRPALVMASLAMTILLGTVVAGVTTRIGNAQSQALGLPLPARFAIPAAVVSSTPPNLAQAPPRHQQQPRGTHSARTAHESNSAPAESASTDIETPESEAKSRNPMVKLGGVFKRINPFQQKASLPKKDAGAN